MSERLKSSNQVSNEEIINDLTKDLNISLNTDEFPGEFVINPSTGGDESPPNEEIAPKTSDIPKPDTSKSDTPQPSTEKTESGDKCTDETDTFKEPDESDSESDNDTADELSLKEEEVVLTDDQKQERKIIAEELKEKGNQAFRTGEYKMSVEKYTLALRTCPLQFSKLRAVLYCNRSAARMKLKKYYRAIKDCTKAVALDENYIKAYVRRAQSFELIDKLDESLEDYMKVLQLDPSYKEARIATTRLPPLIEVKNEKLKTEMIDKLKDLGNMILRPFGLSTSNFQMDQDPESKGYKINFKH